MKSLNKKIDIAEAKGKDKYFKWYSEAISDVLYQ